MKKNVVLILILLLLSFAVVSAQESIPVDPTMHGETPAIEAVKQTIVDAYVNGMFLEGNAEAVKKGWHPECEIVIHQGEGIQKLPISYWIKRFTEHPGPLDPKVTHRFLHVHVQDYAAIAIVEIKSSDKPLYIDFMNLYKFKDGWKICTKTYYGYPRQR